MNLFDARDELLKKVAADRQENTVFLDGIEEGITSTINFILEELEKENAKAAEAQINEAAVRIEKERASETPRVESEADNDGCPTGFEGC